MTARRDNLFRGGDTCVAAVLLLSLLLVPSCKKSPSKPAEVKSETAAASEEHFTDLTPKVQPILAAPPAPKPAKTLPANATCVTAECHTTLATARQIHGPISEKACNSCHQDDIGGHKFPLKRKGNDTCTFCHSVSSTQSHQHKAIEQGCTSCHQPHVSNAKFLLKTDTIEQLCQSCHNVPLKQHAHTPFARGDCTACHQSHQADNVMLLRGGEGAEHCYGCHGEMRQKLQTASQKHKPAINDCTRCHNPHSTEHEHQLVETQDKLCYDCHKGMRSLVKQASVKHGAMETGDKCDNCHDAHASKEPRLLKARTDAVCLTCHDKEIGTPDGRLIANMKPVLTGSKYLHGPNRVGNCSACHGPHGSKNPEPSKGISVAR